MNHLSQPAEALPSSSLAENSGLTHTQIQILAAQSVHPDSAFCNMGFIFWLDGAVDINAFKAAWQSVADGSEAIRTSILNYNTQPLRRLLPEGSCQLETLDFSTGPDPLPAFTEWVHELCATPFELGGELSRSYLCQFGPESFAWVLVQHHLITDAESKRLIFSAVSQSYQELLEKGKTTHDAFPFTSYYQSYSEQSVRTSSQNTGSGNGDQTAKNKRPRRSTLYGFEQNLASTKSERITVPLTLEQSYRLKELSSESCFTNVFPGVSLFTAISTCLIAYLSRVSESETIGFDAPVGNRKTLIAKRAPGCFIEMFPFDIAVEANDTFRTLAERLNAETRAFLTNATPGSSEPSRNNVSNIALNFYPGVFGDFAELPTRVEWIHSGDIDGVYDIKLHVHDFSGEGSLTLQFDISSDTFPKRIRERIPLHFQSILSSCIDNLDTSIKSVDILTKQETEELLVTYNHTDTSPIPRQSVVERFLAKANQHGNAIALRDQNRSLTYGQFETITREHAIALQERGLGPESTVFVAMPRSIEAVVAIVSILRSGAAFIPLDPQMTSQRQRAIVGNCEAVLALVSDVEMLARLSELLPTCLLSELTPSATSGSHPELKSIDPQSLAYVIYTSGTTGQPKGVEIEHAGLADYIDWAERSYIRGEQLKYPLFTSLSFDLTLTSLFLPLVTGGELIVYPQSQAELDSAPIDVINENAVDFLKLTPSHLSLLHKLDLSDSKISRIVVGGENLQQKLASSILSQFKGQVSIFNEYGPTECVVGCMIHEYNPDLDGAGASVPIGKPADHVRIYLLNERQRPVPEGLPGEMYIERNGIARGYRNEPDLTAKAFLPNPFSPSQRLYRTGDWACFTQKGIMTYLGRRDRQVKLSGHRVELGEIESALLSQEGVTRAYAFVTQNKGKHDSPTSEAHCKSCGISTKFPNIVFNDEGVCSICSSYQSIKSEAESYFKDSDRLRLLFAESKRRHNPEYDCMVFFSGGKDSAYALCQLVDLGLNVYAFTLDNGYLSEQAMGNIRAVVEHLGVRHEFASTPAMNEIFKDSLVRYSNVCNGCFKTIYTLGINRAHELGIPIIVTGLSRGQFFETRLTENLFKDGRFNPDEVDEVVLEARKRYHRDNDAVSRCLDTSLFKSDSIFEEITFVDFYRYWDAPLDKIYDYLEKRVPWVRPTDTGRSTNCRVNDVGIYIHQKERGFHNYSLPYSWDVRLGQKLREQSLEELDDNFDLAEVKQMLAEIGYDENRLESHSQKTELVAYYQSENDLPTLQRAIEQCLPRQMRPNRLVRVESFPLTPNGKIDVSALTLQQGDASGASQSRVEPEGPVQEYLYKVWSQSLAEAPLSIHDDFFEMGGTSLAAMETMLQVCQDFDVDLPLQSIFIHSTIAKLGDVVEKHILEQVSELSDEEASALLGEE